MPKDRGSRLGEFEAIEQLVTDAMHELSKQSIRTRPVKRATAKLNQARVRLLSLGVALDKRVDVACPAYPDCRIIGECICNRNRLRTATGGR